MSNERTGESVRGARHSSATVALVLASSTGGVGRHVAALAAALTDAGVAVTVAGPAATNERFGFSDAGARFVPVELPATPRPGDVTAIRTLRRALAETSPDVIHAHGLRAGFAAALARRPQTPLVVTWHNLVLATGARRVVYRRLERYVARAADITLAASTDLVERVRALGGRDVRLGEVAAPSLPPPSRPAQRVRADLGVPPAAPVILSVGRLHRQKRHDVLIAAAARWREREPPPAVLIAGTGPDYTVLAAQALTLRAPVTLLGHRDDVADLLALADIAVVASDWEARQLFAQEALRTGVPLVATAVGGLPGLVGDAAVLVPPGDVDALAAAVVGLLDDPSARRRLFERGLARAAAWPSPTDTVRQIRAVYAELTAAGPTS